jgi:hypothetical protein
MGIYEQLNITGTTTPINESVTYAFIGNNLGCTTVVTNNICVTTSYSGVRIAKDKRCFEKLSNNL